MKTGWFGWPIVGVVVLALLLCGAEQTRATTINFEDLKEPYVLTPSGIAAGDQYVLTPATGVDTKGFHYTPDPWRGTSYNDLHISNAKIDSSYNGTVVAITHNVGILTKEDGKEDGGTFSLHRFDFAGFPKNKEVSFTVTGVRADLPDIEQTFIPDGKVDGVGEKVDFQTFYLDGNWTNLSSVRWTHTGYWTNKGLFALDNIYVDKTSKIPEPSTITLLGLAILGLLCRGWRCRKQL